MPRNTLKSICKLIETANAKVEPEQAFLSDLKRTIELNAQSESRKPSQSYKPSSMNCIRNMWYQMTGAEPDTTLPSYQNVGTAWSGTDVHLRIQSAIMSMKARGINCEYVNVADYVREKKLDYLEVVSQNGPETKLYHKTLHMSFMCDGIIFYEGFYYVLEIKSETSFKFQHRDGVDPKHYNQGIAYSLAFKIPRVIFLYVNRDLFDLKDFMFKPTDEQRENLVGLITDCDGYVERKICPPKPENIERRICEYCGYKERCKQEV